MSEKIISTEDALLKLSSAAGRELLPVERSQWTAIAEARPQIKKFIEYSADKTLAAYGQSLFEKEASISPALIEIINGRVGALLGDSAATSSASALHVLGTIDTSSHGGIFSEDTLVQSHLVIAEGARSRKAPALISLACGVVPMNNSTWPRGFFRRGERESLFPKSFDRIAMHECTAFTKEMLEKRLADKTIDSCTKEIYETIKNTAGIFEYQYFFQQMTRINHTLWSKACAVSGVPDFFHLLLEDITAELIINSIENNDALSRLIFCSEKRSVFLEQFANLPGTWSTDRKKGTFLFWEASGDFRASTMWPSDDGALLMSAQGEIPFTPEEIKEALKTKKIVPGVFLSLVSLLMNGVRPSGGYHQITYLPEYAKRLAQFSQSAEEAQCPIFLGKMNSADLFQLGYGFTFLKDESAKDGFAGIDTLLCTPPEPAKYQESLTGTTIGASILGNSARWFSEIVPKK